MPCAQYVLYHDLVVKMKGDYPCALFFIALCHLCNEVTFVLKINMTVK